MDPWLFSTDARLGFEIGEAKARARSAENDLAKLEGRVAALENACRGMWELLKNRHGYTDDLLVEFIQEFSARTDEPDAYCPICRRKLLIRNALACSWCNQPLRSNPFL